MSDSRPLPQFRCDDIEKSKVHKAWEIWKGSLEYYFESEDIVDQKKKRSKLLHLGGPQLQMLFKSLPDSEKYAFVTPERQYYDVAIAAFDKFFRPGRQDVLERHRLRHMRQQPNERFAEFVVRLRQQVLECGLEKYPNKLRKTLTEIMLIDAIAEGCLSEELRRRILQKDRTLDEIEEVGTSLEEVERQVKDFGSTREAVVSTNQVTHCKTLNHSRSQTTGLAPARSRSHAGGSNATKQLLCFKCGRPGHFSFDPVCPAINVVCPVCNKMGHFKEQCRLRKRKLAFERGRSEVVKKIRAVQEEEDPEVKEEINAVVCGEEGEDRKTYYAFFSGCEDNVIRCIIGGKEVDLLVDSGAEANLISDTVWMKLKREGVQVIRSTKGSDRILKGYANDNPMKILGTFEASISVGKRSTDAQFFVVEGGQRCLLGDKTAKKLGVLKVGVDIDHVQAGQAPFSKISGVQVHIHMDPQAKPVFQPVRRVPVALEEAVFRKLEDMKARDIIEEKTGPASWVSPLVVVGKANGEPRICLDLRRVNEAVLRERHPMPMIDDFLARVGPNMIRSKLDVADSFLQLELDEESRDITTFITTRGIYRFKRMPFGLVIASEAYQKTMDEILVGCEGAWWYIDDIYVEGRTKREHDERLNKVLSRLKQRNVQLNLKKCVFGVTRLEFLGHLITENGIEPSEGKTEALRSFRKPENANELRSFLGLASYLSRFIPNLATVDHSLRNLTKKGVAYEWSKAHDEAFEKIKQLIVTPAALGFFKVGDRTLVMSDASPTGLGALLIQSSSNGESRIICYASKSLTETERRYCHTEKEALSLVWSVEKFYHYLYGREFELLTDCKALVYLFTPRSRPCARIERWVLRLQGFEYMITHIPGEKNLADVLSRLGTLKPVPFDQREEIAVQEIANYSAEAVAIKWEELVEASKQDVMVQKVMRALEEGQPEELPLEYRCFAKELCEVGDVLMRLDRIVIPEALRDRALQIAHEGHIGMRMMKTALRAVVWWPKMDNHVEGFVKRCRGCTLVAAPDPPEPMKRKQMPSGPWEDIAMDFLGPLPEGQWLLVVVDYFSRYVEISEMLQITARDTIRELVAMFSRFGIPQSIRADNGPQLSADCREFKQFCDEHGIELVNTTPYWPQANGEVERQNRSFLKRMQIAQELGKDWRLELRKYLLTYHMTDHPTTGKSPSELMFGRRIKTKLPIIPFFAESNSAASDHDRVSKEKGKEYANRKRRAQSSDLNVGDKVYVKRMQKDNKLSTRFAPEQFVVESRIGSEVLIKSLVSGQKLKRNVVHLKKVERNQGATSEKEDDEVSIEEEGNANEDDNGQEDSQTEMERASCTNQNEVEELVAEREVQRNNRAQEEDQEGPSGPTKRRRQEPKKFLDYIPY